MRYYFFVLNQGHSPPRSAEPSPSVSEEEDTFEVTRKEVSVLIA